MDLIKTVLSYPITEKIIRLVIVCLIFTVIYHLAKKTIARINVQRIAPQTNLLIRKILKYLLVVTFVFYVFDLFDIHLTAVLGAAGIAGVAIGFAAQTSFSNVISGFFLLSDKALKLGDFITVGDVSGTVDSIDFLSVKIHTVDNTMVRIPNETIIKSNLLNISYFPVRRAAIAVSVGYSTDLEHAMQVLRTVANENPLVLKDPEPLVYIDGLGDSGINLVLAVWAESPNFRNMKTSVYVAVQKTFAEEGIEIPFPKCDVNFPETLHVAQKTGDSDTDAV